MQRNILNYSLTLFSDLLQYSAISPIHKFLGKSKIYRFINVLSILLSFMYLNAFSIEKLFTRKILFVKVQYTKKSN